MFFSNCYLDSLLLSKKDEEAHFAQRIRDAAQRFSSQLSGPASTGFRHSL